MYKTDLNIRHSNKSQLFWGVDKNTNQIVHISDVENRGLNCNCRCAYCKVDYVAKLGDVYQHHFAHRSNYNCVYANEVAFYMYTAELLKEIPSIYIPSEAVSTAKCGMDIEIADVYYHVEPEQYPPLLIIETKKRPIRIVLNFGKYYSREDNMRFKEEALHSGWDCLFVQLPQIDESKSISKKQFTELIRQNRNHKQWIYCEEENIRKQNRQMSHQKRWVETNQYRREKPNYDVKEKSKKQSRDMSNLRADETMDLANFNPQLPSEMDKFGRRWFKCKHCKRVITSAECVDYDRTNKTSYGVCRKCGIK